MGVWEIYCAICGGPFVEEATEKGSRKFSKDEEWLRRVKVRGKKGVCTYDMYGHFHNEKEKTVLEIYEHESDCIHEECWKLNGESFKKISPSRGDSELFEYQEQWFEWKQMRKDGKSWMMKDPSTNKKNRNRIKKLIGWLGIIPRKYLIMFYVERSDQDEPERPCWLLVPNTDLTCRQAKVLDKYYESDKYDGILDENTRELDDTENAITDMLLDLHEFCLEGPVKNAKFDRLMEVKYFK